MMSGSTIDDLGYLLHHLAFVLDRQSDILLQERLDIGFSQFKILMALKWDQGVQQKHIAEKLGQTEASVSRQIKLLSEVGLVSIKPTPSDKRQHITVLTKKGDALIEKAFRALNNFHAPVFARISTAKRSELQQMLEVMHDQACQTNRPGGCGH